MEANTSADELAAEVRRTLASLSPATQEMLIPPPPSRPRTRAQAEAAVRRWTGTPPLEAALPSRRDGEPLLGWLARCQQAAVEAALSLAATQDPDLEVTATKAGWVVRHKLTGQRVEVITTREVGRSP